MSRPNWQPRQTTSEAADSRHILARWHGCEVVVRRALLDGSPSQLMQSTKGRIRVKRSVVPQQLVAPKRRDTCKLPNQRSKGSMLACERISERAQCHDALILADHAGTLVELECASRTLFYVCAEPALKTNTVVVFVCSRPSIHSRPCPSAPSIHQILSRNHTDKLTKPRSEAAAPY